MIDCRHAPKLTIAVWILRANKVNSQAPCFAFARDKTIEPCQLQAWTQDNDLSSLLKLDNHKQWRHTAALRTVTTPMANHQCNTNLRPHRTMNTREVKSTNKRRRRMGTTIRIKGQWVVASRHSIRHSSLKGPSIMTYGRAYWYKHSFPPPPG